jgi:hypothetical protein
VYEKKGGVLMELGWAARYWAGLMQRA